MPFTILRGDISRVQADALVNAANSSMTPGAGCAEHCFPPPGVPGRRNRDAADL